MAEFPIFEEIKNFIYVNIEYLLLIIAPICTLILFLANKINQKIESEQTDNAETKKEILEKINKLELKINEFEKKFNDFELNIRLKVQALQFSMHGNHNNRKRKTKKNMDDDEENYDGVGLIS